MAIVLSMGGEWYLGVTEEEKSSAAMACWMGAAIYGLYLFFCMSRLKSANARQKLKEEEADV